MLLSSNPLPKGRPTTQLPAAIPTDRPACYVEESRQRRSYRPPTVRIQPKTSALIS